MLTICVWSSQTINVYLATDFAFLDDDFSRLSNPNPTYSIAFLATGFTREQAYMYRFTVDATFYHDDDDDGLGQAVVDRAAREIHSVTVMS